MRAKSKHNELNTEENELDLNELGNEIPSDQYTGPDFDNLEEVYDDENLNVEPDEENVENINEENPEQPVDGEELPVNAEVSDVDHELASYVIGHAVESPVATEFDDEQELKYDASDREFFNNPVVEESEVGLNEIEGLEEPEDSLNEIEGLEEPELNLNEVEDLEETYTEYREFNEEPIEYHEEEHTKVKKQPKINPTVEPKNDRLIISGNSFSEKYSNLKRLVVKPSKKFEKLKFKLDEGFDHEANEKKIIELENRTDDKTYNKTEFDNWLLKNYKLYKFKGTAKKIEVEYKKLSMGDSSSEDPFTLKVKFQKAFVPSIFYDAKNGIVARKLKDYLVTEYEGDMVPYSYLNENQVDYFVDDLIYEDAVNQVNCLDAKKKDNDEVKKIYYDEFCYTDSLENLKGSQKLKKAYHKMGILSLILGLIIIILGVLTLIGPIVEQIKDVINLEGLAMPLFISGGSLCFIFVLYHCFKGPLSTKIKKLIRLKSKYLVFMYNNKRIDNAIYSILRAKVRTVNTKNLSKKPKSLRALDYDVISSITDGQIQNAKMQRETKRTSNSLVKWMGRIHSVLASTLFAGGITTLIDAIMTSFESSSETKSFETSSLALTYLVAFGISAVLGLIFLMSRKKPILRKSLYYLHGLVVLIAVIVIKMFVL